MGDVIEEIDGVECATYDAAMAAILIGLERDAASQCTSDAASTNASNERLTLEQRLALSAATASGAPPPPPPLPTVRVRLRRTPQRVLLASRMAMLVASSFAWCHANEAQTHPPFFPRNTSRWPIITLLLLTPPCPPRLICCSRLTAANSPKQTPNHQGGV